MAGSLFKTTVGEVCQVFDGPHATPTRLDSGPVFLGITSLNKGRIDLAASDHVSEEDFAKWTRRVTPRPGDVVFSYETKLGEAAIIPEGLRCCLGRRMGLMRPYSKRLDSRFLLYYYLGPEFQDVIRERTIHGSTVERLALIEFPQFPLRIPPLNEQKAIAAVLGALDDKIELNRRMNATLEAMARALFQSWFVDFDPVRAKLDGRQPVGLDPGTAALFPDSFHDSQIGHIPTGWEVGRLDDALVLKRGFDLPATERTHGKYPVMAASGPNGCHDKFMVKGPGVTTGRSGVLGKVFFIHGDFWPLNTSLWVKEFMRVSPAYAYHLLRGLDFVVFNAGSAVPTLNRNHVHNLPIVIPPKQVIEAFNAHVMPLMKQQQATEDQSRTLATLRDTLLPKLLSGELSVAAATETMEVAR